MRWSGATGAIARCKRVSTGCGRTGRSVPAWPWICGVKPTPKAGNKPSPHSIVHGLDKPGVFTTVSMEHEGFSFTTLRTSLQVLLNRKRIAEKGNLQPDVVPLVRIPPNARERNQWVIKQALDTGVYGLVLPHLSTVEDAQAAVAAARYPQVPGVQDF